MNGNAWKFAEEMESSGTADKIWAEEGNVRYEYFFPMKPTIAKLRNKYYLQMKWNGTCLMRSEYRLKMKNL